MLVGNQSGILLIARDAALLAAVEPLLLSTGARITVAFSPSSALVNLAAEVPPSLVLFDIEAAHIDGETSFCQWLHEARKAANGHRIPIVLIADTVHDDWATCLTEGTLDDLIPRSVNSVFWKLRLSMVLRNFQHMRELERLRENAAIDARMDHLTGICNRTTLLAMLFRETDRVQRMKTPLSLVLFDVDDFGQLNARIGPAACDDLLCQIVGRTMRLLRSYDLFGRTGNDEFLLILPGCGTSDAQMLSERLRNDVFGISFPINGNSLTVSACFGLAPSQGRSPIVVLRAAEEALAKAKRAGQSVIHVAGNGNEAEPTADFLSACSGDEILAW